MRRSSRVPALPILSRCSWLVLPILTLILVVVATTPATAAPPPPEICDGLDNNGNGQIDEGFDTDGDGVARCCGKGPYFVTTTIAGNQIFAHHNQCSSSFTTDPAPMAELPAGGNIRVHGVADLDANGNLETLWSHVATGDRYITACNGVEWVTDHHGHWSFPHFGGADIDLDGVTDFVGWDLPGPAGTTALSSGGYAELYGSWDPSPALPAWITRRTYNAQDVDLDGLPDLVFYSYPSGGASTTSLYGASGNGAGFNAATPLGSIVNQPQNYGDLGDLDNDGCTDWIGGPDDDGNRGSIYAGFGDCAGNFAFTAAPVADACVGCPGSGTAHGSGMSQLYYWDCDDCLDLLTVHVTTTGATSTVLYYRGDCSGTFSNPIPVLTAAPIRSMIASPLRN